MENKPWSFPLWFLHLEKRWGSFMFFFSQNLSNFMFMFTLHELYFVMNLLNQINTQWTFGLVFIPGLLKCVASSCQKCIISYSKVGRLCVLYLFIYVFALPCCSNLFTKSEAVILFTSTYFGVAAFKPHNWLSAEHCSVSLAFLIVCQNTGKCDLSKSIDWILCK